MTRPSASEPGRPSFPGLREDIGEDPARYLTFDDPYPRINGIRRQEVAAAYLAVARRLGVRSDVREDIQSVRDQLAEQEVEA